MQKYITMLQWNSSLKECLMLHKNGSDSVDCITSDDSSTQLNINLISFALAYSLQAQWSSHGWLDFYQTVLHHRKSEKRSVTVMTERYSYVGGRGVRISSQFSAGMGYE